MGILSFSFAQKRDGFRSFLICRYVGLFLTPYFLPHPPFCSAGENRTERFFIIKMTVACGEAKRRHDFLCLSSCWVSCPLSVSSSCHVMEGEGKADEVRRRREGLNSKLI